jgi:N-acetylmuramidase
MSAVTSAVRTPLAQIIASIESTNNHAAIRFEPRLYAAESILDKTLVARIQGANDCDSNTARMIACTSWGAFQVLGENIYSLRWSDSIGLFLMSPSAQTDMFESFLTFRKLPNDWNALKSNGPLLENFARVYNGSPAYSIRMRDAAAALQL